MTDQAKPNRSTPDNIIEALIEELTSLRSEMIELEKQYFLGETRLNATHAQSARNFLHYLAFRRSDLRQVQDQLAELGLSSLDRAESHVLATLETVLATFRLGFRSRFRDFGPSAFNGKTHLVLIRELLGFFTQ